MIGHNTIEEKVFKKSINKSVLATRVTEEKHPENLFTASELEEMTEVDDWVQCDKCQKWRMLPRWCYPAGSPELESLTDADKFECSIEKKLNIACYSEEWSATEYQKKFNQAQEKLEEKEKELSESQVRAREDISLRSIALTSSHATYTQNSERLEELDDDGEKDDIIEALQSQETVKASITSVVQHSSFFEGNDADDERFNNENVMKTLELFRQREEEEEQVRVQEMIQAKRQAHERREREEQERREQNKLHYQQQQQYEQQMMYGHQQQPHSSTVQLYPGMANNSDSLFQMPGTSVMDAVRARINPRGGSGGGINMLSSSDHGHLQVNMNIQAALARDNALAKKARESENLNHMTQLQVR